MLVDLEFPNIDIWNSYRTSDGEYIMTSEIGIQLNPKSALSQRHYTSKRRARNGKTCGGIITAPSIRLCWMPIFPKLNTMRNQGELQNILYRDKTRINPLLSLFL